MAKKPAIAWGTSEYLVKTFDDIESAVKVTARTKAHSTVRAAVMGMANPSNKMEVLDVFRCTVNRCGVKSTEVLAVIAMGLNGNGSQAVYFDAVSSLLANNPGWCVVECVVRVTNDTMGIIVNCKGVK